MYKSEAQKFLVGYLTIRSHIIAVTIIQFDNP